jgi:glyoxylase-like metal-dependent hydrolase (beta-lactamase superfamily II)
LSDLAEVVIDPPDRTIAAAGTIHVGGRPVDLRYLGRGHTDNDIIVSVTGADVVFAGDLIEGGATPAFEDAYPLDWPATARSLAELVSGTVVPGHGDHADRSFVAGQADALARLVELARRVDRSEITIDDAIQLTPFPDFPPSQIRVPLVRALAQLRGELD